jgi:hypothetical protein
MARADSTVRRENRNNDGRIRRLVEKPEMVSAALADASENRTWYRSDQQACRKVRQGVRGVGQLVEKSAMMSVKLAVAPDI